MLRDDRLHAVPGRRVGHRFFRAGWLFGQNVMGITPKDVVYSSGLPLYHSSGLILGWAATYAALRETVSDGLTGVSPVLYNRPTFVPPVPSR